MIYISIKNKILNPYLKVNIGDKVVYKNRNGNYYKGKVISNEEWHNPTGLMTKKKFGIKVDFDDIVLLLKKSELFTVNKDNQDQLKKKL